MLKGKHVLLGVTGSIAAYKAAELTSLLVKAGALVDVIMTENATKFIHPITFESLTGRKCMTDTFDRNFSFEVEHISVATRSDLAVIAPADANVIGKLACGIADDMLTTTLLACKCPKLLAPAMNTNMYDNPIVQRNLSTLREFGYEEIVPATGRLACGTSGRGKMESPEKIMEYVLRELAREKDWAGKRLLVTAGPTQEAIDPVRYITNHSSGRMGYAIARMAMLRGAEVTLVTGPTSLPTPAFVRVIPVKSAEEMYEAVSAEYEGQDVIIKSAAVADYTPADPASEKIKKSNQDAVLALRRTKDILAFLGENRREGQYVCGFSMETEHLLENSRRKLEKKHVDLIAANNLKVEGAGFGVDTNVLTLIGRDFCKELPLMSKEDAASALLDVILEELNA